MFTMFTSTKEEKIMKGQKRYYLLPYEKSNSDVYTFAPCHIRQREKEKKLTLKRDLSKCRKTNVDMTPFG